MNGFQEQKKNIINDHALIEYGHDDDHGEEDGPACSHGCFGLFGFSSEQNKNSNDTEPVYLFRGSNSRTLEVSWKKKLHKAREFVKAFGGPKGKKLVRKIAACRKWCPNQKIGLRKKKKNKFQYDAHSYALNFDAGRIGEGEALDFTARYADPSKDEHYSIVQPVVYSDL